MAKITRHGGASDHPWPLRGTEPVVGEAGPELVDIPDEPLLEIEEAEPVKTPRGNASHSEWAGFIRHQNYPGDPYAVGRDDLRAWWYEHHGGGPDDTSDAAGTASDDGPPAGAAAASGGAAASDDDADAEDA